MAVFVNGLREPTKEEIKRIRKWIGLSESEKNRLLRKAERDRKNGK